MGLLDQVIGGVLGQVLGGGRGHQQGAPSGGSASGGNLGGAMLPIVQALLMLLMSKGGGGGLGDLLGGGQPAPRHEGRGPGRQDDGDMGGFGQDRGGGFESSGRGGQGGGGFSDLSGMLDGPGDRAGGRDPGAGPYARLDQEVGEGQPGLDGLIDRFQRGGLGDMMESWIGHGQNRPVQPNQLADALGPETVDALQQKTGLDRNDLMSQLAEALPQVIDRLTPQGRPPNREESRGW